MEGQGMIELPMGQLMKIYEQNDGKNCVVFDKNGNCDSFFEY